MVGTITFSAKRSNSTQWGTQYAVDVGAKRSNQCMHYAVHSGIVVYGGEDIVFGAKRSNQRTQYAVE